MYERSNRKFPRGNFLRRLPKRSGPLARSDRVSEGPGSIGLPRGDLMTGDMIPLPRDDSIPGTLVEFSADYSDEESCAELLRR